VGLPGAEASTGAPISVHVRFADGAEVTVDNVARGTRLTVDRP
jgi:hypothetical protein